jgi:concanavalin A-like lectin/glucanase superfamily protein/reprolysin-like metallo-peptidase family M12B/Big-like domain-containing protein
MLPGLALLLSIALQGEPRLAVTSERAGLVALELPATPPERVSLSVPLGELELERHSLRAPAAFVRVVGPDGVGHDAPPPPVTTYRGRVRGEAGSVVLASLLPEGWRARIELGTGESFELVPAATRGLHALRVAAPADFRCGAPDAAAVLAPGELEAFTTRPAAGRCLQLAEIAFDADLQYYQAKGSSVPNVVAAIDAILNEVDFFYERDVQITFTLTAYVVRTTAFYQPTSGGNLLDLFRAEWNTNQASIPRDLAHLMTGQPGSLIEYGGLAWVGTVCTDLQYGWSMDGANIVGHEVGHNFGAGHCHDLEPCNNMCGACFYVGPNTRRIMTAFRDSLGCLDPAGDRPPPVAPYAMPDRARGRKDALASGVALDVLANDDDGDCQPLFVVDFERTSALGGGVRRAAGTSADWRERLVYTPPAEPFVGTDRFAYQVSDGTLASTGAVEIEALPLELLGYWPLDEGVGTLAADAGRGALDGTLSGGPLWTAGRLGSALHFDGTNDRVTLPALQAHTNQLTLTCWVRRQGAQDNFAGLVFSRAGNTVAGLSLTSAGALRYTWNGDPATYNYNPGITLPDDQWAFVALVIEPARATLYYRSTVLVTRVNAVEHAPEEFDGQTLLGQDALGVRRFQGWLDDVRVYGYALNAAEIARLAAASGPADAPFPRDGSTISDLVDTLAWVPGVDALTHDVYFGTSAAAVDTATTSSPEFQGNLAGTSFTPAALVPGQRYFWRVDERTAATLERGPLWQLERAVHHRWRLDETSGTNADDSAGGIDGTYLNGVALGQPGASASLGRSAAFDGTNDRVSIPALGLASNRVTLTCWLRRNGAQNPWSALLFSRASSTVAGLHFGSGQELRYTWNDDGSTWGWDSGLVVPDGQWVFAAVVVEPTRATMYLGQGGTLASATNAIPHAAEAFDGALWLGRDPSSTARHFRGGLDDVRVYDHALTPGEVEMLYLGSL